MTNAMPKAYTTWLRLPICVLSLLQLHFQISNYSIHKQEGMAIEYFRVVLQSVSLHSFPTYFYLATRKNPDPQQGIILVSCSDEVKSCQTQCSVMQWIDQVELSAEC